MQNIIIIFIVIISWVVSSLAQDTLKIMPLGDSITRGLSGSLKVGRAGYRQPLYDSLVNKLNLSPADGSPKHNFPDFDFVGSNILFYDFSDPNVNTFDVNHEGNSGWHSSNLLNTDISLLHNIREILLLNPPDIILLHIGTNDIEFDTAQTTANLVNEVSDILDTIYNFNPNIYIILAKIINRAGLNSLTDSVTAFNNNLGIMVNRRIINGDKLHMVDMETSSGIFYDIDESYPYDSDKDMIDILHPNDNGYRKMAGVWFNKIKEILSPLLVSPENNSKNMFTSTTFSWHPAFHSSGYELQVAEDSTFSNIVFEDKKFIDTFYTINSLKYGSKYFWRVDNKLNTGTIPNSDIRNFTTLSFTGVDNEDLIPNNLELYQNYPNPFNPITKIKFSLPHQARVRIDVFNIMGEPVSTLINEEMQPGYHILKFDTNNLSSGTYICRLLSENFSQTVKMILIK